MRFFMMGYTTIWACGQLRGSKPWLALAAAVMILACGTTDLITLFFLGLLTIVYVIDSNFKAPWKFGRLLIGGIIVLGIGILLYALAMDLRFSPKVPVYWHRFIYLLAAMAVVFIAVLNKRNNHWLLRLLIIVPLAGSYFICVSNCLEYLQLRKNGPGAWEMLRDWEDMQHYVRDHTPKDAMILTPYDMDMGGFRIHSNRKVLVCYRDCGIIGFDYAAAVEWSKRINDIKAFKVFTGGPVDQAVLVAILKYRVNYIVFMKYYGPPGDTSIFKKLYDNEVFSLFQVL
jgi:hypothetical protein